MQLTLALRLISGWEPFSSLPQAAQAVLAESLQALQLRPGQKLYDYDALPGGGSVGQGADAFAGPR